MLYELIYYSIASPGLKPGDIADILEVAHKNNPENNLTGCLLYHNDAFLQILEGEKEIIESLYVKIEQDKRHYNVKRIYNDYKEERLFTNWRMAFFDLNNDDTLDTGKLIYRKAFTEISNQTVHSTVATQLFWQISNQLLND